MEKIIILVQEYNKDNANYVFCNNLSSPGDNFRLRKNYINKFARPIKIGKYYLVDYCQTPSECGNYMNHKINVITELKEETALTMTMS